MAVLSCLLLTLAAQSFSAIGASRPTEERPLLSDVFPAVTPLVRAEKPRPAAVKESVIKAAESRPEPAAPLVDSQSDPGSAPDAGTEPGRDVTATDDDAPPSLDEIIALRAQNVSPEMIRELRSLFPRVTLMEIASMSAVGVTPEFVREMRQLGLDVPSAGDAQSLAAVGVTREFVRAMRRVGFTLTSAGEAQGLKAVGVTPEYVRDMRAAGFPIRSAGDAQGLMAVGVTPDYVREMRKAGVELDEDGARSLCALGVTPDFVRRLANAGYPNPTVSQLSRLAAAGVTGDFIREMSQYRSR